ncbi:MAG: CDP-glycerol glycerophosphotransferase family protein, partial [Clostridiales bacterium]|nr:CDP-glycerol glycerophosphotransferase family protein [Clostridiales bacterium]
GKAHAVIEQGYPRNDFLFRYTQADVCQIREDLGLPPEKKVILYAPTFRDNAHLDGVGYTLDREIDFTVLRDALGEAYVILFRAHYFVADTFDFAPWEGFLYDVSTYHDINHLYVVSDLLVTDYSSVFFDYANLGRPILFYMYDLEQYRDRLRGFYLELSDLPGPVVRTEQELADAIRQENWTGCDRDAFQSRFNPYEDGNAGRRVIDAVWFSGHDRSAAGE